MTPFKSVSLANQFTQPQPGLYVISLFTWDRLILMTTSRSHDVVTTPFTCGHPMDVSSVYMWPDGYGTEKSFRPVSIIMPCMNQIQFRVCIYVVNVQHENSKSMALAFRPCVGEGNFRPVSSNIPYITDSIQWFGNNKVLKWGFQMCLHRCIGDTWMEDQLK